MAKFRSAKSYFGRTAEAKENQRRNLVPGGPWQKKRTAELRLNCWWDVGDIWTKRFMFEGYEKKRDIKDVPDEEMKSEKFLDNWWSDLELGNKNEGGGKEYIYWCMMDGIDQVKKAIILKYTRNCLKEKLALMGKS